MAAACKEEGNKKFIAGDLDGALSCYTRALKLCDEKSVDRGTVYKNRAAVYLKLSQYQNAINDCTAALDQIPNDAKALFRRSQAYEQVGNLNEAFKDAKMVQHVEPQNKAVQPILARLSVKIQELTKKQESTIARVEQMLEILIDENQTAEKRSQAASNLFVLARENAGAEYIVQEKGVSKLYKTIKETKDSEMRLSCIRIFGELCKKHVPRTKIVLKQLGGEFLVDQLCTKDLNQITAGQYVIQIMLNSLAGMNPMEGVKFDKNLLKIHAEQIDEIMIALTRRSNSRVMTALGRDAILEILMKNVDHEALFWGLKLVNGGGVYNLMEVASELPEVRYESSMDITENTRTNVAVALDRIYLCMDHDAAREKFQDAVKEFVCDKLKGPDIEGKVGVTAAITVLLQGPIDVGNTCLAQQGVVEMMIVMAGTEDEVQQRVAAEALIAAASKKDKCSSIISMGMDILKKLMLSKNDNIKVRALVGLCKVGSFGGTDASIKPFADGSSLKLALACRKFLVNPKKDKDLRKWAAEGLAYLTLDGDVKEELIEDAPAIQALIELAKSGNKSVLYGCVTTLVNLTNSYDKQEMMPELLELAKFAKQHIPEEHIKDTKEFTDKRVKILTELGVCTALVALSTTESKNSKELISRVFNSICEQQELRGAVVQQGGAKSLVKLALDNTDNGKLIAAQALARIGITINPEVAFPGQRAAEVVRPLMSLLHPDCTGLQNFEGLMALTNLAQVSPSVRQRILADSGLSKVENYAYEEHEDLRRASVQCLVNLMPSEDVIHMYEGENDRVKLLIVLADDEDYETAKAAAGALAMLVSVSQKASLKIFDSKLWHEVLCKLTASEDKELQHRGLCILNSLVGTSKEAAEKVFETNLLEVVMALTLPEVPIAEKLKDLARDTLKKAESWKVIEKPKEDDD